MNEKRSYFICELNLLKLTFLPLTLQHDTKKEVKRKQNKIKHSCELKAQVLCYGSLDKKVYVGEHWVLTEKN